MTLRCLWIRNWISPYLARTLPEGRARAVARHLSGCAHCWKVAHQRERLTALVRGVAAETTEPDWTGFWPGIHARILSEGALVGRPSWRPRPAWPLAWLPRLALGSAVAGLLLFGLFLWRSDDRLEPAVPGIVVQALEVPNPNTSVMVFTAPEHGLTVIWVFGLDPSTDQSLRQQEDARWVWRVPFSSGPSWS